MSIDPAAVRQRLLGGAIQSLAALVVDDLAGRRVADLVDGPAWAGLVADAVRAAAADPGLEDRLRLGLHAACEAPPPPDDLVEPARALLAGPWSGDPALMRALLDHRAVRNLIRDVLTESLLRFGRSLRAMVPVGGLPRGRLGRLAEVATGVASAAAGVVAGEVERQLEGRVRDFVDEAIGRALDRSVSYLSGRDAMADLGAWRAHALDVLVRRDAAAARADVLRLDRQGFVAELARAVRSVAAWEGLDAHVLERVRDAVGRAGDRTAGELLEAAVPGWRGRVADAWAARAADVAASDAFGAWLTALLADPEPPAAPGAPGRAGARRRS